MKRKHLLPRQLALIAAYEQVGNISAACRASDVGRREHYEWMKRDAQYHARFLEANEVAADALEEEARRRAIEGCRKYKFTTKGDPIKHPVSGEWYFEDDRSDTLLIFLLKAARPEKYRERFENRLTGSEGGPVQLAIAEVLVDATIDVSSQTSTEVTVNVGTGEDNPAAS